MIIYLYLKIFFMEYKKILISISFMVFILLAVYSSATYLENRKSLVEKFTLGVVVLDENKYLDILLDIITEREDISSVLEFKIMEESSANTLIKQKKIPCYIIIPKGFTNSIITGKNNDVIFVGNINDTIKYNISKVLVTAGVAYLSSSQSGIYATIDFAYKNNIDKNIISDKIVMDINMAFGKSLLDYSSYYEDKLVFPTGSLPVKTHYLYSFITFFILINCIPLYNKISSLLQKNVFYRAKIFGINSYKYIFYIFVSLFLFILIFSIPAFFVFGIKTIPIVFCISIFILFCSVVFKDSISFSNFVFVSAIFMLFVSGGIIPKVFLPDIINYISLISINYYVLNINNSINYTLYLFLYSTGLLAMIPVLAKKD